MKKQNLTTSNVNSHKNKTKKYKVFTAKPLELVFIIKPTTRRYFDIKYYFKHSFPSVFIPSLYDLKKY